MGWAADEAKFRPLYEALAGAPRWNGRSLSTDLEPKLGTGDWITLALGPTDDEYSESVLCVGDGGLWLPDKNLNFRK